MRNSPLLPSWVTTFSACSSPCRSPREDKFASLMSEAGKTSYGATSTSSSTPAPISTDAPVHHATPGEEPPMPPPSGPPEFADTVTTEDYGTATLPTSAAGSNKSPTSTSPSTARGQELRLGQCRRSSRHPNPRPTRLPPHRGVLRQLQHRREYPARPPQFPPRAQGIPLCQPSPLRQHPSQRQTLHLLCLILQALGL